MDGGVTAATPATAAGGGAAAPAARPSARNVRVAMLCANDWRQDGRVVREAEALARNGYDVHVVALSAGESVTERVAGVIYHSIAEPRRPTFSQALLEPLRVHLALLAQD